MHSYTTGAPRSQLLNPEPTEKGKKKRNDRRIAVGATSQPFASFQTIDDLPRKLRTEIDEFFTTYHRPQGKQSRTLAWKNPIAAQRLIDKARQEHDAK